MFFKTFLRNVVRQPKCKYGICKIQIYWQLSPEYHLCVQQLSRWNLSGCQLYPQCTLPHLRITYHHVFFKYLKTDILNHCCLGRKLKYKTYFTVVTFNVFSFIYKCAKIGWNHLWCPVGMLDLALLEQIHIETLKSFLMVLNQLGAGQKKGEKDQKTGCLRYKCTGGRKRKKGYK